MRLEGEYIVIHESHDRIILQETAGGSMDGGMFSITIDEVGGGMPPALVINRIKENPMVKG